MTEELLNASNAAHTFGIEAAARIGEYTRSLMYHKFTGQPKRGILCRLLPAIPMLTKQDWIAVGVDEADLTDCPSSFSVDDFDVQPIKVLGADCSPWWETGALFYEIAESRLAREDCERRLTLRRVTRSEWLRHVHYERSARRDAERIAQELLNKRREAFAYQTMADLVTTIVELAERNERGTQEEG